MKTEPIKSEEGRRIAGKVELFIPDTIPAPDWVLDGSSHAVKLEIGDKCYYFNGVVDGAVIKIDKNSLFEVKP